MNIKNVIRYILMMLIAFLSQLLCNIIYPIIFLFRNKILQFAESKIENDIENKVFKLKSNVKKYKLYCSPLFWGFLFTTGLNKEFPGPLWYKKEQKLKWFSRFNEFGLPIPETFKQKIQYFWLSYCWCGFRNAAWAFSSWFFREGAASLDSTKVYYENTVEKLDLTITPGAKFKEKDGTYRNNSGPYIRYTFDSLEKWNVTNEGTKILTFKTYKGNERFFYGKAKIYKLDIIKKFLIIEYLFGWNWWDGIKFFHFKNMFKKMDDFAVQDYNKYLQYINNLKTN